jgi:hypothetical protein
MVVAVGWTEKQERTVDRLIRWEHPPSLPEGFEARVRDRLEAGLAGVGVPFGPAGRSETIWLGKRRLSSHERCEGMFETHLLREEPPFEHNPRSAAGSLFHEAIRVDLLSGRELAFDAASREALGRVRRREPSFERFWEETDRFDRADLLAEAGRHLDIFRTAFPPLARSWAPQPEHQMRVRLAGGRVALLGTPDLVLGRTWRLIIDFKSGEAWPEHAEDMRFYALLGLLWAGKAPYRVATFFLGSGQWQAEDVGEETVERAIERVVSAAGTAVRLRAGGRPELRPGRHCGWCARSQTCPASSARREEVKPSAAGPG